METKPLMYGIIGFLLGGFIVSVAATQLNSDSNTANSEMSMTDMTDDLKTKSRDDFDKAFISYMIEHHQSAVEMAKLADERAMHSEVKDLSRDIITAQQSEITEMRKWQSDWNYEDVNHSMH